MDLNELLHEYLLKFY